MYRKSYSKTYLLNMISGIFLSYSIQIQIQKKKKKKKKNKIIRKNTQNPQTKKKK